MRALGVRTLGDFVVKSQGRGAAAIRRAIPAGPMQDALLEALSSDRVRPGRGAEAGGPGTLYEPARPRGRPC